MSLTTVQLENDKFDTLFHSPLKRAAKTASIIWGDRQGKIVVMPSLREIDLYSFQVCSPCQMLPMPELHGNV